jgi:hypothetical protein
LFGLEINQNFKKWHDTENTENTEKKEEVKKEVKESIGINETEAV